MAKLIYTLSLLLICSQGISQKLSIQELLGYSPNTKLLIIHADDLGMSHSENQASISALENSCVNSASIMVPCPWFGEIAAYAKTHPEMDFGVHLTLNCEWKHYKWKPISNANEVPGLIDENGFFYGNQKDVRKNASDKEVEIELRAQIETALNYGINITHLDSHMFALFTDPSFIAVYKKLGKEYQLPILLNGSFMNMWDLDKQELIAGEELVTDQVYMALPNDAKGGLDKYYKKTLNSLKPGLNVILLHAAYDNEEMQAITIDHEDFGSNWRQQDLDFFSSESCNEIIARQGIQLITWAEIKDKLFNN